MTPHNITPPPAGEQHQRHRLVARALLAAGYESRYGSTAVSAYGLAVRDVVESCPEVGPIDTWSRLSERICRDRPGRNRDTLRKRLSRHFTTETKGPPWPTVVLVVEYTVPKADRAATLDHLGRLYEAAREERPPSRGREPAGPVRPHAETHSNDSGGSGSPARATAAVVAGTTAAAVAVRTGCGGRTLRCAEGWPPARPRTICSAPPSVRRLGRR